jgi:hypothetical protein
MFLPNGAEDLVPVRTTKVCRRAEGSDGVLLCTDVLNNDVVHVVFLDLRGEVDVDFNAILRVLFLNGVQEGMEPFSCAEVTDNPSEVNLQTVSTFLYLIRKHAPSTTASAWSG